MQLKIDKVSEDNFYFNLLLGLPKLLLIKYKKLGVKCYTIKRFRGIKEEDLEYFESKYDTSLPTDLKDFYRSTNGFLFKWTFSFGPDEPEIIGHIIINCLQHLKPMLDVQNGQHSGISKDGDLYKLKLGKGSKVFELVSLGNNIRVVIVFLNRRVPASYWVQTPENGYFLLANDFASYFRMNIVHLGIPNWQLLYTKSGMPQWSINMMHLLAPHLLQNNVIKIEGKVKPSGNTEGRVNVLDLNVFKPNYSEIEASKKHSTHVREKYVCKQEKSPRISTPKKQKRKSLKHKVNVK